MPPMSWPKRLAETAVLREPTMEVLHNVNAAAASPDDLRDLLARQLYSPVRWVETVQAMAGRGVTLAIEAGPGQGPDRARQAHRQSASDPAGVRPAG
jgi:malonyl CoA-acyl carrier protein transacylase